jgi:hypothetical protein
VDPNHVIKYSHQKLVLKIKEPENRNKKKTTQAIIISDQMNMRRLSSARVVVLFSPPKIHMVTSEI